MIREGNGAIAKCGGPFLFALARSVGVFDFLQDEASMPQK